MSFSSSPVVRRLCGDGDDRHRPRSGRRPAARRAHHVDSGRRWSRHRRARLFYKWLKAAEEAMRSPSTNQALRRPRGAPVRGRARRHRLRICRSATRMRVHAAAAPAAIRAAARRCSSSTAAAAATRSRTCARRRAWSARRSTGLRLRVDHRRPPRQHARQYAALDPRSAACRARHGDARPQRRRKRMRATSPRSSTRARNDFRAERNPVAEVTGDGERASQKSRLPAPGLIS
jgi:hypothetical protein